MSFRRFILPALAAIAALYALSVTWRNHERAAGLDFYIYFVNAQLAARDDIDNIYAPEVQSRIGEEYFERAQRSGSELRKYDATRRRRLDNVSSPFLYTTLRWVSRDYERALRQYHALVLAAFIAGVLLIARRVRLSWAAALFLLAALLLWYRGFEADLRVGNVNSLQLLMIGVLLNVAPGFSRASGGRAEARPYVAGAVTGLLIAFKPNLVLIALLVLFARVASHEWIRLRREVAGAAFGGAIALLAAAINYGSFAVWLQWLTAAAEFFGRLQTRAERNVAPALALHEIGWGYAVAAVLIAIACFAIWKSKTRDDALIAGIAIVIYLLSAPVVWLHYMVLALPLAIALMRNRATAVVSVIALAMIAEEPFELLFRVPVYPNDAWHIAPALIALFVCGIWRMSDAHETAAAL
ncbi:MAG TPA: glycosyltransferase 87 family protein [Thermoanaerobaculia bacterium]|nr:glycosyltransferase 87 family protein [Thermoanaerobaculia bacterium]